MATMRPKKNPITKIVGGVLKAAGKSAKPSLKTAKKAKPLAKPKSAVRAKPAAKQKPNKPDDAKISYKVRDSSGRAYNKAAKEYEEGAGRHGNMYEMQAEARDAMFRAPTGRKTSIQGKKLSQAEARKATTPRPSKDVVNSNPWDRRVEINTNPLKTTGFSNLKRKVASINTPANRAKTKATARALKAANKKKK